MEVFPENIFSNYPAQFGSQWRTLVTNFESGTEQRRKRWAFPKRHIKLSYKRLKEDKIKDFWKFYQDRQGTLEAFWFFALAERYFYNEYVNRGDGSTVTFDLPSKNTTQASVTVYVDGVSSSFTFISGGGQGSSDRVTMAIAPANGALITADFYGRLRLKARFDSDMLSDDLVILLDYDMDIGIQEAK